MTEIISMPKIYKKLEKVGFHQEYVLENGLPRWWNEELDHKPLAVLEGAGCIADRFGLDFKSLLTDSFSIEIEPQPETKFKQDLKNNKNIQVTQAIAGRLAEMIADGTEISFTSIPSDVNEIREDILTYHTTINLDSILDYCWKKGIAVAYFQDFPKRAKKIDGMIQYRSNRPVIIISCKRNNSPWLAFILAHELGHLALGHITEGTLIDDKIQLKQNLIGTPEEEQANQFAVSLLLGDCDNCLGDKPFHGSHHLIKYLKITAENNPTVEMSSIALNYAWHNNSWGIATKALNKLALLTDGQKIINRYLSERLDWDKFNDDSYEYLEKILEV